MKNLDLNNVLQLAAVGVILVVCIIWIIRRLRRKSSDNCCDSSCCCCSVKDACKKPKSDKSNR